MFALSPHTVHSLVERRLAVDLDKEFLRSAMARFSFVAMAETIHPMREGAGGNPALRQWLAEDEDKIGRVGRCWRSAVSALLSNRACAVDPAR